MNIIINENDIELGTQAAAKAAEVINNAISDKGIARILMATGTSQFTTLEALLAADIDWSKVEMFHLDEYVGIPQGHPASLVTFLKDRFVNKVNLKQANFVETQKGTQVIIDALTKKFEGIEIDCGLIGIGANGHIAFNDPPADFDTDEVYKVVELDAVCRNQQYSEGWFNSIDDVPTHALTMGVKQILKCKTIVSAVPYEVKAQAVKDTLTQDVTPNVPATILKTHPNWFLYLDKESASLLDD